MQKARVVNLIYPKTEPRILNKDEGQGEAKAIHMGETVHQTGASTFTSLVAGCCKHPIFMMEKYDSHSAPSKGGFDY